MPTGSQQAFQNFLALTPEQKRSQEGLSKIFGEGDWIEQGKRKEFNKSLAAYGTRERYLPPELRGLGGKGGPLDLGMQGIGEMIRRPGQLSRTALSDIQPRLNQENRSIEQNYRNLASEQAGAAARGNAPVSIKNALAKALGTSEQRAKGEAANQALMESDELRRSDLDQTYGLLDTILQYMSSGGGQAVPGINAANALQSQLTNSSRAGNTALIGSLLQAYGGGGGT